MNATLEHILRLVGHSAGVKKATETRIDAALRCREVVREVRQWELEQQLAMDEQGYIELGRRRRHQ